MSTKETILNVGCALGEYMGVRSLTRQQVARASGFAGSTVVFHFKNTQSLKRAVWQHGLKICSLNVVAEGILAGEIQSAPADLCAEICKRIQTCSD